MTHDETIPILARLESGFRNDFARLKHLEEDLAATLHSARDFGKKHGAPEDWNTSWQQAWDNLEGMLQRIKALLQALDESIISSELDRLARAQESWDAFQVEDTKLMDGLEVIRRQALGLNATVREEWNRLAGKLTAHFDAIHACAEVLQIKIEWLKKYSREEVNHLVGDILSKLPNRATAEVTDYAQEYRRAMIEIEQEHHQFMGFMDVVKSLLMRVETPEVRVRANRSLRLDPV